MKAILSAAAFLAGVVSAQDCVSKPPRGMSPEPCKQPADCNYCYLTMNDLKNGPCKAVTWIFARASTELGNMGAAVGTLIGIQLNQTYGHENFAMQGVDYEAGLMGNVGGVGCSNKGVSGSQEMFNMAHTKCPNTVIVAGGYSQGTACMHAAIPKLSTEVRNQIAGVVLFGDTRYTQENKKIRGLTEDKYKIYCNDGDAVCKGTLSIQDAHFRYAPAVPDAVKFLTTNIAKMKPDIGGGAAGGSSPAAGGSAAGATTGSAKGAKGSGLKGAGGAAKSPKGAKGTGSASAMEGEAGHSHGARRIKVRDDKLSFVVDKYQSKADGTTYYAA